MPGQMKWAISFLAGGGLIVLGWKVPVLLTTLHILLCFLLIIVVLLQSGKAADLAGAFGGAGSQTAFGPRGAATFLSKATTWCAVMFMVTSMTLVLRQEKVVGTGSSVLEQVSKPAPKAPAPPASTPKQQQQPPAQQPPASQAPAQQPPPPPKK